MHAGGLARALALDAGSLSRILRRFAARGLVVLGEPLRTGFAIGTAGVLAALALAGTRQ